MIFDQMSLMTAIAFASAALSLTLVMAWATARMETFLVGWAAGLAQIMVAVMLFTVVRFDYSSAIHYFAFVCLIGAFSTILASAHQFRRGNWDWRRVALFAGPGFAATSLPWALGYDGVGAAIGNLGCAVLIAMTAREYWLNRDEAPVPLVTVCLLHLMVSISFGLCALAIVQQGIWVLEQGPANWAEDINAIVAIFGVTGIGAMSLALNQTRLARRHEVDAMTDALTGLFNRRALFERVGSRPLAAGSVVMVCDLDRFKRINDQFGHACGDAVLRRFAEVLRASTRREDLVGRLGGEEFAIVMQGRGEGAARSVAERLRERFAAEIVRSGRRAVQATVSIGIAAGTGTQSFEDLLGIADAGLYAAKQDGRNLVRQVETSLAA